MRIRSRRPGHATVVAYVALFVALGGTALATTQGFVLGTTNHVDAASKVTNVKADNTQNAIASPLLKLENLTTGTGASALALNVASGHPPFTTNSATRVTNLNADEVDGLHSSSFVTTTDFRSVGPLTPTQIGSVQLATIGNLSFRGDCSPGDASSNLPDLVQIVITSAVAHSTFGALTQDVAGGGVGAGDMAAGTDYQVARALVQPAGTPNFNPVSGSAVEPNGHQVVFNLYQGMNVRNQDRVCIFGGTFAVK